MTHAEEAAAVIADADPNNNKGRRISDELQLNSVVTQVENVVVGVNGDEFTLPKVLWDPATTNINQDTKLKHFTALIESKYNLTFTDYAALHKWSVDNFVLFWQEFWHFSNIRYSKPYVKVLDKPESKPDDLPFRWFERAELNYAENLLRYDDDKVAVYSFGEAFKKIKSITFKNLRSRVKVYQSALKRAGVTRGDVVVGYMPNSIECLEAKLAVNSLGAVWSCASPDFGPISVIDRFKQVSPKLMFSVTSVGYNGKKYDHRAKVAEVIKAIDSIEKCVLIPFYDDMLDTHDEIPKSITLDEFLSGKEGESSGDLTFEQVPFNHPLVILYSSGTTGAPKCIVHSHGTGWMMYDWLISSLAIGATIVLYDGSPVLPTINVLWDLADELKVTMFGTSAKWLAVIEEKGCIPKNTHKLDSINIIFSTGSPLKPNSFDFVYNSIKKDVVLGSITGGTDIISLFCGHNVNLPVYRGEIQCRHLGMAVECVNEDGQNVLDECGDLVCTRPFPSMPVYFHNDPEYEKYKQSYFQKYEHVWTHGDFCVINSNTGGVTMLGRSDGTLNPNGVRFGSADIYNAIESMTEICDSLCVAQKNPSIPSEERVVLFLKLSDGVVFDKTLVDKVKSKIRGDLSPRHVPSVVLPIAEIPYTLNGKKVEVPVRRIIDGERVIPSSSLANPKCLELFRSIDDLKKWQL